MENVSILSALPHCYEDVANAMENPNRDYIYRLCGAYQPSSSPEEIWSWLEPGLGVLAGSIFERAREKGIDVVLNARRQDITEAAKKSNLMILVAHWKGPCLPMEPSDILVDSTDWSELLHGCVQAGLLHRSVCLDVDQALSPAIAKKILRNALNSAIDDPNNWARALSRYFGEAFESGFVSGSDGRNFVRLWLDQVIGEANILSGGCLDLSDGLWRPENLVECFPENWAGVCDFACCQSAYLSGQIKLHRRQSLFRADTRFLRPENVLEFCAAFVDGFDEFDGGAQVFGFNSGLFEKYQAFATAWDATQANVQPSKEKGCSNDSYR